MRCLCGGWLALKATGKARWSAPLSKKRVAVVACARCREVYDYACWLVRTRSGKVEAYPRGVTLEGLVLAPRCSKCANCQEWLLSAADAGACMGQPFRRRGLIETGVAR